MNDTSKAISVESVKQKEGGSGMYYGYCGPGKRHQRRLALLRRMGEAKQAYVKAVKAKMQPAMVIYMNSHVSIPGFGDAQPAAPQLAKKVRKPKVKAAPMVDVIVKAQKQPAKPRSRAKKPSADVASA